MKNLVRVAVLLAALLGGYSQAWAQSCTVSLDQLNFGKVRLADLAASGTVATLTADCSGRTGETIRLCPTVQSGLLNHARDSASHLRLNLFLDPSHHIPLQSGLDILLGGPSGIGHATMTVYGLISPYAGPFKGGDYHATVNLGLVGAYLSAGPPLCSTTAVARRFVAPARTPVKAVAARR